MNRNSAESYRFLPQNQVDFQLDRFYFFHQYHFIVLTFYIFVSYVDILCYVMLYFQGESSDFYPGRHIVSVLAQNTCLVNSEFLC